MASPYDYSTFADEPEECSNCGKPFPEDQLTTMPEEWSHVKACPACAADFLAADEADQLADCAIAAIFEAKSVGEMTGLLKTHISTCAACGISVLQPITIRPVQFTAPEFTRKEVA